MDKAREAFVKRIIALVLISVFMLAAGCSAKNGPHGELESSIKPTDTAAEPTPSTGPSNAPEDKQGEGVIGFIIKDDNDYGTYELMYGFLKSAGDLGRSSMLFKYEDGKALEAVENANASGCRGLLIMSDGGANAAAIERAREYGIKVVVPVEKYEPDADSANIYIDDTRYMEDACLVIAERMEQRGLDLGTILVYGSQTEREFESFSNTLKAHYPQYSVAQLTRTGSGEQGDIDKLSSYLYDNRHIKGMFVTDASSTPIAAAARKKAQELYSSEDTESPDETPEGPQESGKIAVTICGSELSDENIALLSGNDIYGLSVTPYFDVAAQSVILLDGLMAEYATVKSFCVRRSIARNETIARYVGIYDEIKELFGQ